MGKFQIREYWKKINAVKYDGTLTSIDNIKKLIHDEFILDIYSVVVSSGESIVCYSDAPKMIYFSVKVKCDDNFITVRRFGMNLNDYMVKSPDSGLLVIPGSIFREIYHGDSSEDDKESADE